MQAVVCNIAVKMTVRFVPAVGVTRRYDRNREDESVGEYEFLLVGFRYPALPLLLFFSLFELLTRLPARYWTSG